jgi:hypothetical protein
MRSVVLACGFCLLLATQGGCSRRGPQGGQPGADAPAGEPDPKPAEAAPKLAGRWSLALPKGAKYEVTLHQGDGGRYRLEKAHNFTGVYELRENRLVMIEAPVKGREGFVWEIRGAEELVLVAQPPNLTSDPRTYLGATLKRLGDQPPPPRGPGKGGSTAEPPPKLPEGPPKLAGRWSLTLPKGAKYEVLVREADGGRYRLEKAVAFTGAYERQGNKLVMVEAEGKPSEPFVWESRGAGEFVLVAQPPELTNDPRAYIGATLKRVGDLPPGDASPKKGEDSRPKAPPKSSRGLAEPNRHPPSFGEPSSA